MSHPALAVAGGLLGASLPRGVIVDQLNVTIQHANGDKRSDVDVPRDMTVSGLLNLVCEEWELPVDGTYHLRSQALGRMLRATDALGAVGIRSGDRLELLPDVSAGGAR
ncbi:MAG: ubiquitin-like domain-containing protein [Thermomicrobiales bacterium]